MANDLRVRVTNGRIVLDEATDLPEGTLLDLVPCVDVEELADEERETLHAAINRGLDQARIGLARPIEDMLRDIRNRR